MLIGLASALKTPIHLQTTLRSMFALSRYRLSNRKQQSYSAFFVFTPRAQGDKDLGGHGKRHDLRRGIVGLTAVATFCR